jgi:hypothetical protein
MFLFKFTVRGFKCLLALNIELNMYIDKYLQKYLVKNNQIFKTVEI